MMRISKKDPFSWFMENFGFGGVSNYSAEQIRDILKALRLILENTGYAEQEWLGKFLIKLSKDPRTCGAMLYDLLEKGY
jgi:hypothetical protein